jgi:mono/diheme cytochrome c family protein
MFRLTRWALAAAVPALIMAAGATGLMAQQPPQGGSQPAADPVARGRYIVEDVAMCWRCHTRVDAHGDRDHTHWLLGGQVGIRPTVPGTADWAILAPRLAGAPPGTDAQFITLMTTGISRTGYPPRQPMPQFRLTQADAEAVLAYLKSLGSHAPTPAAAPAPVLTRK